jgi:hypothetical protein
MSAKEEILAGRLLALAFVMALAEAMMETAKEIGNRRGETHEND